jgi:hypothetical protein
MLMPLSIESGGNDPTDWIEVPSRITKYEDVTHVVEQVRSLDEVHDIASKLRIPLELPQSRMELVGYLLGIMLGDA